MNPNGKQTVFQSEVFGQMVTGGWAVAKPAAYSGELYEEVYRLWEAKCEVLGPKEGDGWFHRPNESLDGLKPIEVIERGEIDRVWDLVSQMQTDLRN